jgi:predicted SnoaL-like aldol condensation-catalyzing enzyme
MEITRRNLLAGAASATLVGAACAAIPAIAAEQEPAASATEASSAVSDATGTSDQGDAHIASALAMINCFASGDTETVASLLTEDYIQHNLAYATGRDAVVESIAGLAAAEAPTLVANVRAFSDGDYVFLQSIYDFAGAGEQVGFDIFRFEGDLIAEHWDNLAALSKPNPALHTQYDGVREASDLDKTEENRELIKNFLYDVMQGNNSDKTADYFDGDAYIQHNVAMADGVSGLSAALQSLAEQGISMVYDTVHMVLAQGDMVLAVSEGTYGGVPTAYYDLWRVENGFVAEHWDVMETIPDESTWANENGKF